MKLVGCPVGCPVVRPMNICFQKPGNENHSYEDLLRRQSVVIYGIKINF